MQVQGQSQLVAEVALGRIGVNQGLVMTARPPSDVSIPGAIRIVTEVKEGGDNKAGFDMSWTRCASGACFATAKPDAASLAKIRAAKAGCIAFMDAAGRNIAAPLSLNRNRSGN